MPVNPSARDVDPPPASGRHEQRETAAVRPEMRASPREDPEEPRRPRRCPRSLDTATVCDAEGPVPV